MSAENWIGLFFLLYVLFLLFGAPYLAKKQAEATLAAWDRENRRELEKFLDKRK